MTEIESLVCYYGFINTEFVQWTLTEAGHIQICTLSGTRIYISNENWQYKRTIFGPGKIEFKLPYFGNVFVFFIRMTAVRERSVNDFLFRAGKNSVFNLSSHPFSSRFKSKNELADADGVPQDEIIDPDRIFPLSKSKNASARGITKTAIYGGYNARIIKGLDNTKALLDGKVAAWMDVFIALNTYAIMSNTLTNLSEEEYTVVYRALHDEFCALGYFDVYFGSFIPFHSLLNKIRKSGDLPNFEAVGSWAMGRAAYGSTAFVHQNEVETKLQSVGEELFSHLSVLASVASKLEDSGKLDWTVY